MNTFMACHCYLPKNTNIYVSQGSAEKILFRQGIKHACYSGRFIQDTVYQILSVSTAFIYDRNISAYFLLEHDIVFTNTAFKFHSVV